MITLPKNRIHKLLFRCVVAALLCAASARVRAVEILYSGSTGFNTTVPTSSQIPNWNTGWSGTGVTGWNYEGIVGGASGVYLGNEWVLTAGHVGAGDFTLSGTTYTMVQGSAKTISNSMGTADLSLFQIQGNPGLPALTIATSSPQPSSDQVAIMGFGGGHGQTWGLNTVTQANGIVGMSGFVSVVLTTGYGNFQAGNGTLFSNQASLVGGDSGGGDFIFNSGSGTWTLAGINEEVESDNDSSMVQLSSYASQIYGFDGIAAVPESGSFVQVGLGLAALLAFRHRSFRRVASDAR